MPPTAGLSALQTAQLVVALTVTCVTTIATVLALAWRGGRLVQRLTGALEHLADRVDDALERTATELARHDQTLRDHAERITRTEEGVRALGASLRAGRAPSRADD